MKKILIYIIFILSSLLFMGTAFAIDDSIDGGSDIRTTDSISVSYNINNNTNFEDKYELNYKNDNLKSNLLNETDGTVSYSATVTATATTYNYYVNPSTGNDNNAGTSNAPLKSIEKAVTKAGNWNKIYLCSGTYTISSSSAVNKNLTFEGQNRNSVTINANHKFVFNIATNNKLILKNLKITNGEGDYGGAIKLKTKSSLEVQNCQFENCIGSRGGAICNVDLNSKITINNSSFINNKASKLGGAVLNTGNFSTTTITNSIFTTNKMTAASYDSYPTCGGALYFGGQTTNTVKNCTFTGNEAFNGGGVYCAAASSTTFSNLTFSNNIARYSTSYGYGGGIMVGAGTANFNLLIFTGNKAIRGGAISINSGSTYTISSSKFNDNYAYNFGGACNFYGTITLKNSNLTNNQAVKYGGAIFNTGTSDIISIINCRLVSNKALNSSDSSLSTSYGGAVSSSGISSKYIIKNSIFNNNKAHRGGAISSQANNIFWTIENNTFTSNTASQHGGAIYNKGSSNTFDLNKSTFTSNSVSSYGGALLSDGLNSKIEITNSTFTSNSATLLGGAIFNQKNTTIDGKNNLYKNNKVTTTGGSGGAICNKDTNSFLNLHKDEYRGNVATKGSAICNYASNSWINCSILVNSGQQIYSEKSMDARYNWWGNNAGNTSSSNLVNCKNPVVFSASVTNLGVNNNIRTISVHVSVYYYNDSGTLKTLDKYIPKVVINIDNNLGSITTDYQKSETRTLSSSISNIKVTLDNQPLTLSVTGSSTSSVPVIEDYDYVVDLSDVDSFNGNHIILNVDNGTCELNGLLDKDYSRFSFDGSSVVIEDNVLKIKFDNDGIDHDVYVSSMIFTDDVLGTDLVSTNILDTDVVKSIKVDDRINSIV